MHENREQIPAANGLATVELPAKTFTYPFVFTPPPHCASSFEHAHASVRYFAKVVLQLPLLTRNQTFKKPFTLVAIADLNKMKEALVSLDALTIRPSGRALTLP